MNFGNIKTTILWVFLFCPFFLFSQEKMEKEYRIKKKNVPVPALFFMDSVGIKVKTKWYKEEGLEKNSIEVKFKYKKRSYSIEFDTLGKVEDVEVSRKWREIDKSTQKLIENQLLKDCAKYKVEKIQIQYKGLDKYLYEIVKNPNSKTPLQIKYELIVKCKSNGGVDLYEYLFNSQGDTVSKSKIIFKNSSHLEY
jgi:hypothetical protein